MAGKSGTGNPGDFADQEAALTRARSRSVFVCTPIARHPVRQYCFAMARTQIFLQQLGIRSYVQTVVGNSNLPRARNELVAAFLASDFDDLLFIDDDMGWEPNDVLRLLGSERDFIGAVGVKKVACADTNPAKWCFRPLAGDVRQDAMGAIEVEAIGTGFLKLTRPVFMEMIAAHPDWKRRGFPTMPPAARALYYRFFFFPDSEDEPGEDIGFCWEHRRLGGTVWLDPAIRLTHVGECEYSGDLSALLEAGP